MIVFHPWAWVGWLAAALVVLSGTRNPLYLSLILLCIFIVNTSTAKNKATLTPISPLRLAFLVIPLAGAFNAVTVHVGDTTLVRLPVLVRLPTGQPFLGGPITLEALVYGLLNGVVIAGIYAAFLTLNQALPVRALVRLIPRAFYPMAVVTSIAVTFVPITLRQFRQIREAQAVRGHRVRGLRDWLPLFMPLLIGGLERALGLAEAMTARGFASADTPSSTRRDLIARTAIVAGLVALLSGWLLRLGWRQYLLGTTLMLTGSGLIVGVLWALGRRVPHTAYRPQPWRRADSAIILSAAIVLLILIVPGVDRSSLYYYPYPALNLPVFDPLIGVATLGLLGPAFLLSNPRPHTFE